MRRAQRHNCGHAQHRGIAHDRIHLVALEYTDRERDCHAWLRDGFDRREPGDVHRVFRDSAHVPGPFVSAAVKQCNRIAGLQTKDLSQAMGIIARQLCTVAWCVVSGHMDSGARHCYILRAPLLPLIS